MEEGLVFEALRRGLIGPDEAKAKLKPGGLDTATSPVDVKNLYKSGKVDRNNAIQQLQNVGVQNPESLLDSEEQDNLPTSIGKGVLGTAANVARGYTFGLGDEISAGMASPIIAASKTAMGYPTTLKQGYEQALPVTRQIQDEYAPMPLRVGAQITGSALNPINRRFLTGAPYKEALSSAGLIKNFGAGATSGAAYGFGEAEGDVSDRLKGALKGAAFGGVTGAAIPAAVAGTGKAIPAVQEGYNNISRGFGKKTADEWQKVGDTMLEGSNTTLQAANRSGTMLAPSAVDKGIDDILSSMKYAEKAKSNSSNRLYGDTISVLQDLEQMKGKPATLEQLHELRQTMGQMISKNLKANPQDAHKAAELMGKFDNFMQGLKPTDLAKGGKENVNNLYQYLGEYSNYKRFDDFRKLVEWADGDVNKVRNTVKGWFKPGREKVLRGFNDGQKELLRAFSNGSKGEGLINLAGKAGIDIEHPTNHWFGALVATLLSGGAHGVGTGGATLAGGTIARLMGKKIGQGKIENILDALSNAPNPRAALPNPTEVIRRVP